MAKTGSLYNRRLLAGFLYIPRVRIPRECETTMVLITGVRHQGTFPWTFINNGDFNHR